MGIFDWLSTISRTWRESRELAAYAKGQQYACRQLAPYWPLGLADADNYLRALEVAREARSRVWRRMSISGVDREFDRGVLDVCDKVDRAMGFDSEVEHG